MTDSNKDFLSFAGEGQPKPSGGLKVITVLTFIWSVIEFGLGIYGYQSAEKNYEETKKLLASSDLAKAPGWAKSFINEEGVQLAKNAMINKMPILIVTLLGAALCFYGAMEMRKLRKQGYLVWLVGEILPLVSMLFFVGSAYFSGLRALGFLFPIIFIILYTVYRKELIR